MAQWLIGNRLLKAPRKERFPVDFHFRVDSLVHYLIDQIVQRHKELAAETRNANTALANFIKVVNLIVNLICYNYFKLKEDFSVHSASPIVSPSSNNSIMLWRNWT